MVLENEKMLESIEPYRNQLPHLKTIIIYEGKIPENSANDIISWQDTIRIGNEDASNEFIDERQMNMAINQCCVLVYTSGTTGNPKGKNK